MQALETPGGDETLAIGLCAEYAWLLEIILHEFSSK